MATNIKKIPLSGSTNGKAINVTSTTSPGQTIHQATASTTEGEVDKLSLAFSASDPESEDNSLILEVDGEEVYRKEATSLVIHNFIEFVLQGSETVTAYLSGSFSDADAYIKILGWVDRIEIT